jgi:hypothetical protein
MKVGDLVSLSSYGKRLSYVSRHLRDYGKTRSGVKTEPRTPPLIGLLTKMEDKRYSWAKTKYKVSWIGEGPPGREHYATYFYRSDLKMVSKS